MVETNNNRTDSLITQKSNSSVYGDQPVSLHVNWMKHDVTKVDPEALRKSIPAKPTKGLSPLRQKLQLKAEELTKKRQLLTLSEIEAKIDEARLRKDYAKADALSAQVLARMNRALESKIKHAYLLQKANLRHQSEETKKQECEKVLKENNEKREQVNLKRVVIAEKGEEGLQNLNQMNMDLEDLIRQAYKKIKNEEALENKENRQTVTVAN